MNINFNDPLFWVATPGLTIFLVALVVFLRKEFIDLKERKSLKREIGNKKVEAEENIEKFEELLTNRRMSIVGLSHYASQLAKEVEENWKDVQNSCSILFQKVDPSVKNTERYRDHADRYEKYGAHLPFEERTDKFLWMTFLSPWMIFWGDRFPRIFSKPPRVRNNSTLAVLSTKMSRLLKRQSSVLAELVELASPIRTGETRDEFVDRMAKKRASAKKRRQSQEEKLERLETVKVGLQHFIDYIKKCYVEGEKTITAGARCLNLEMVTDDLNKVFKQIETMEAKGTDTEKIISFIEDLLSYIRTSYEGSAGMVARAELSLDELKGRVESMSQKLGKDSITLQELKQATVILEEKVPVLWATRQADKLGSKIEEVDSLLIQAGVEVKSLEYWLERITALQQRITLIEEKEKKLLKEVYGVEVEHTKAFDRHINLFEQAPELWTKFDFKQLEELLDKVEANVERHKVKVGNKLVEVGELSLWEMNSDTLASVSGDEDFTHKLLKVRAAGSKKPPPRFVPEEPTLTGKMIRIRSPEEEGGTEISVDSFHLEHFKNLGYEILGEEN